MDTILRLKQALDYLRYQGVETQHENIAKTLNRERVSVTKALNGNKRYLTKPFLKDFAQAYSSYINEEWLVNGNGPMCPPDETERPHFEAKASAGFMSGESRPEMSPEMRAAIVDIPEYDFTIEVTGDSMEPEIRNGDILACLRCTDSLNPPMRRICVLDLREGPVVKIISSINTDSVTLHSLNPRYRDYEVPFADILGVAAVIGVIRTLP